MGNQFIGEIRLFGFPRIPDGWLACAGQSLSISQFDTLYALSARLMAATVPALSIFLISAAALRSDRDRPQASRTMCWGRLVVRSSTR